MKKILLLSLAAFAVHFNASAQYAFTKLDVPGAVKTEAYGVSGNNVVGYFQNGGGIHGFLYNGSAFTTLNVPGAVQTYATGISGNRVAGYYQNRLGVYHGFTYQAGVYVTNLTVPGAVQTYFWGASGGNLAGYYGTGSATHGFIYNGSTYTNVDVPGAVSTLALGIAASGVVGYYADSSGNQHGFTFDGAAYTTLDYPAATLTEAFGVDGSVVGFYQDASSQNHGFVFNGTSYTALNVFGATSTYAYGIAGGKIVGSFTSNNVTHGFIALPVNYTAAYLTVLTNGGGGIKPNLNGTPLAVGSNYTLTATASAGFQFTGWLNGSYDLVTTNRALNFLMMSNLLFIANFADVRPPALTVAAPTAATVTANKIFTARGSASDNAAVASVQCQLNGGGWNPANGTINWNLMVDLSPGTNYFAAYAVDTSNNRSATNRIKFIYTTAPATLNRIKAEVTADGAATPFEMAFGAATFSQTSDTTNNVNGVGRYTYTRLTPATALLKANYTAPPSATNNLLLRSVGLYFSGAGAARFTNDTGLSGGIVFTSTPVLAPANLANHTADFVHESGAGEQTRFTATTAQSIDLITLATNFNSRFTYTVFSPVGALLKINGTNGITYFVATFLGTNYGSGYAENYATNGAYRGLDFSVFGLASQRPGGNAPTNLVSRTASVSSVGDIFTLTFLDGQNFTQTSPVDGSLLNQGGYVYARTGPNTGRLLLNDTAPPGTSQAVFQFLAPNVAYFTNLDNTIGAAVLK